MVIYPATFENDGKFILVLFPDFPEAITQGETMEQAYAAAQEVLGMVLEDYTTLPKATPLEEVSQSGKACALISVDMDAYRRKYLSKTVRKNVTVPEYLVELAKKENVNMSQVLTESLKEKFSIV